MMRTLQRFSALATEVMNALVPIVLLGVITAGVFWLLAVAAIIGVMLVRELK